MSATPLNEESDQARPVPSDVEPSRSRHATTDWLWFGPIIILIALWIVTRPYAGIIHDGRLYTIQAMHSLDPRRFGRDLYFEFGSQDAFTLFSYVYTPLVSSLGASTAHLIMTLLGQAAWLSAIILLSRTLFGTGKTSLLVVISCVVLDSYYGAFRIFHYGEPFATPRIFAESLILIAFAAVNRKRLMFAAVSLLAAAALHPIMALTGVAFLMVLAALREKRIWLLAPLGVAFAIGLALLKVEPFSRLLTSFDDEWFAVILKRCGFAFLGRWHWTDWLNIAGDSALLMVAYRVASLLEKRLLLALLITLVGGLAVTYMGADLARNVMIVNAQPWRVLWLLTLASNIAAALLWLRLPRAYVSREAIAVWFAAMVVAGFFSIPSYYLDALKIFAAAMAAAECRRATPLQRPWRVSLRAVVMITAIVIVGILVIELQFPYIGPTLAQVGLLILCLVALRSRLAWARSIKFALASAVLLAVSISSFDQRGIWQRFVEGSERSRSLESFAGSGSRIYWEGGLEVQWFKMSSPAYYSCLQGTGAMFYRGTAIEYERRSKVLATLNSRDFSSVEDGICANKAHKTTRSSPSGADLAYVCKNLPELEILILRQPVRNVSAQVWSSSFAAVYSGLGNARKPLKYYKYSCSPWRAL